MCDLNAFKCVKICLVLGTWSILVNEKNSVKHFKYIFIFNLYNTAYYYPHFNEEEIGDTIAPF